MQTFVDDQWWIDTTCKHNFASWCGDIDGRYKSKRMMMLACEYERESHLAQQPVIVATGDVVLGGLLEIDLNFRPLTGQCVAVSTHVMLSVW